ncbi:hypothetical protein LEN26_010329 [Aphanomyces euteiches]|nr:hypothetical protein LEN26_010329 [Aphanomyces euteiches]KAH9128044.1 hypothetical protein AeMF1_001740 [Aphanomyces euteiches]KAH9191805.1 hypothetical protein AeNC1_006225 [Aphanomyces euteiches]
MGARVSAKRIVAGRRNESNESEFDLDEEERRIKEIQEKNKQIVVSFFVARFFQCVRIKIQRIDMPEDVKEKKKHVYLWITIDDHVLKQQNVPLDATFSYPLAVAVDITGDTYVTDRTNGQRRLKSQDILALATATTPPIPPDSVSLIEATGHSLRVGWREASGSIVDRFEVQYKLYKDMHGSKPWLFLANSILPSHMSLEMLDCHTAYVFRVRSHNPAGWSDYSPLSGPFTTLAGAPENPQPPFAAVISDTFINVCWTPVPDNGAPILAYSLEMKNADQINSVFTEIYRGHDCGYLVANLAPKSILMFRLKAMNSVGETLWTESKPIRTKEFARPEVQELPSGGTDRWVECWDGKEEKVFYFNKYTCQRSYEVPAEILEARRKAGDSESVESPEMIFRKKRFHFHRELRANLPAHTAPFDLTLHRQTMFEETVARFQRASKKDLQLKPRITFDDEGGIDSGGLTKDWYLQVSRLAADKSRGLFRPLDNSLLEINPEADTPDHLKLFRFFGKFLAKAIFDRHVVHLPLAPVLYKHFVGLAITTEDLIAMDPQFHKSLKWIEDNDVTDVLYETFSITRSNNSIVDLKENGRNIDVTEANKHEYVKLMMQWRTEFAVRPQLDALFNGMHVLLPNHALHCFEWSEVELLLNGNPNIDVDLLRANVNFQGGYDANAQVVLWLWQALRTWDNAKRQLFLKFTTGSPAIPLDGFEPPFTITKSDLEPTALPRSHTCFNQLVLPEYLSYAVLQEKITFAIQNTEGFELS